MNSGGSQIAHKIIATITSRGRLGFVSLQDTAAGRF